MRVYRQVLMFLFCALWMVPDRAGAQSASIEWEVENPFRFFTDPELTDMHREIFKSLNPGEAERPIESAERRLAEEFAGGWAEAAVSKTCWRSEEHLHGKCRKNNPYINPKFHAVRVRLAERQEIFGDCRWSVKPIRKRDRSFTRRRVTGPCDEAVTIKIPYPAGATVQVSLPDGKTLKKTIKVRDIFIVGIGDSFASGEGNPDRPVRFSADRASSYGEAPNGLVLAGYPARVGAWKVIGDPEFKRNGSRWLGQACHRSLYSHQTRVALQLAIEDPHRAVTYAHFACAGSEITRGLFVNYKGNEWVPSPPRVPQISSVAEAQCGTRPVETKNYPVAYTLGGKLPILTDMFLKKCPLKRARRIDLLFVAIGGNDVGFSRLLANAVLADKSVLRKLGGWIGTVYTPRDARPYLQELALRYKALNRALHGLLHIPWNQSDRIILTGYPPMALVDEDGRTCPDGQAGMSVFPEFRLNAKKFRAGQKIADQLNIIMRKAARRHGWSFVDTHRREFIGHGLCAGNDQIEIGEADDLRLPRKINGRWEPFAPTQYRPYASRQRWFRTPNDAYLTGHFHVKRSIARKVLGLKKLQWFQLVLASAYSGAFHPTAQGQAVMADAVLIRARRVLRKYR